MLLEVVISMLKAGLLKVGLIELEVDSAMLEVGITVLKMGSIILEDDSTKLDDVVKVLVIMLEIRWNVCEVGLIVL